MVDAGSPQVIIKVKRKPYRGQHGGAWKVAYADFVTAMMALFIVLWLLTQADLELRQQIARYFRNSSVLSGGSLVGNQTESIKSEKLRPLEAAISLVQTTGHDLEALRGHAKSIERMVADTPELEEIKDLVRVAVTDEGLEIQIMDSGAAEGKDLLFEVSSAELKPALLKLLQKLAARLGTLPNRLRIGGHTDARPFPSDVGLTNWDLAFARANNARKILEGSGLRRNQVLAVIAYADKKPLNRDNPYAAENRRLSVTALRERASDDSASGHDVDGAPTTATDPGPSTPTAERATPPSPAGSSEAGTPPNFAPRFSIPGLPPA